MGETTKISWTDHTFNIAHGCFKISPGCAHCYAETFTKRVTDQVIWGPPEQTARRTFGAKHWNEPYKWARQAEKDCRRHKVFTSSMADVFEDHPTITEERARLWDVIRLTPQLDWQILTKRAERIAACLPEDWGSGWDNVWLGVSVENQEYADARISQLLAVPAKVHFISAEPLLGPINVRPYVKLFRNDHVVDPTGAAYQRLDWIIVGGESGPGYRPMDHAWARDIRDAAQAEGVGFWMKQSAAPRTEMGTYLEEVDGARWVWKQFPNELTPPQKYVGT